MPTSEARIRANQANAARSTGPKTPEGKERSRANAVKHGLTGDGIVIHAEDVEEVERRFVAFRNELQPSSELGLTLVRRAATLAVRMEKCTEREMAAIEDRIVQAMAEVEVPDGTDPAEVLRLQAEAGRLAAFDTSKEACLARRYEAAAERGFFRALKEFRRVEREARTAPSRPEVPAVPESLGSFLPVEPIPQKVRETSPPTVIKAASPPISKHWEPNKPLWEPAFGPGCDLPFAIGKSR
jgi:hypothetical protein